MQPPSVSEEVFSHILNSSVKQIIGSHRMTNLLHTQQPSANSL